jgi:subtilisin family serine protease
MIMSSGLRVFQAVVGTALVVAMSLGSSVFAKGASTTADSSAKQRYIVVLEDLPLAAYDGRIIHTPERFSESTRLEPTANRFTGDRKLDIKSDRSQQYLNFLDERFESFRGAATLKLGRHLQSTHRYRIATNGFAAELSESEAAALRDTPGVVAVRRDEIQRLHTDSGPAWLGADKIHDGSAGFLESGGEGIIVGVIDSGVNWDHSAFADPGQDFPELGWDHENPYGEHLGLCSEELVLCNDKLVGVYDFVEDDPATDETEENTDGKDNTGHGSHVMSIAVGNPDDVTLNGFPAVISGVAPNANLVSYRVCYIGDAADPDDDGCQGSAILKAIDQAITDQVDVLNYSVGGDAFNPWVPGSTPMAFLNARDSGIFVATSTGNAGPNSGTIGSPANAPWIVAVGNATHDRVFASVLENLSGGDTTPPDNLAGASFTDGIGVRQIVHAKDYGYPLCGVGPAESQPDCASNTGATNPFNPGTFNGEIVVCDRGEYGRVEKGKNVMLAGAGGYVLANKDTSGDLSNIVADDHCLPATHLDFEAGEELRTWLDSGSNHQGSISGFSIYHIDEAGDVISGTSSRGPNLPPVENVLKPDLIAPGTDILGASSVGSEFLFLTGTSMASPQVAGGAALIKSVHPGWTPSMLASTMALTSTTVLAVDFDRSAETPHKRGSGRPQLDQAVNAGLYLDETRAGFIAANPVSGGKPKNLNLPGLVDTVCRGTCDFQRTVTDLVGGASWSASAHGFDDGVSVSVSPSSFSLANGASRALTISIDLTQSNSVGAWVYGEVRLTSNGYPDAVFPVAVFSDGGALPVQWQISTDSVSGWQEFALSGLANMRDATYTSGGLVEPTMTVESLPQDPNPDSPYDGTEGVMTVWHDVPANTLWLHTETLQSTATDLDLFVGLDTNGDGIAQESEELCASTSPTDIELCDLFTPVAGSYWVLVQNWEATNVSDEATLKSAVVGKNTTSLLTATGTGIIPTGEALDVRLSWDNVSAVPGTELIGAVGIGTDRSNPNNIGIIPVNFTKTGVAEPETLVLMDGIKRGVTLAANSMHDYAFIDVPPGAASLTVMANSEEGAQSSNLTIELYRIEFAAAFQDAPFASAVDTNGDPIAAASGGNGNGPEVSVSGDSLAPGRWYAVIKNNNAGNVAVEVQADLSFTGDPIPLRTGLWESALVQNLEKQGIDYTKSGPYRAFLWYSYNEDGTPTWYQAGGLEPEGNVWVANLNRYTNDGTLQQLTSVGRISITVISEQELMFSFVIFGQEGSDKQKPSFSSDCPDDNGTKRSYTGIWSRDAVGVGGASVVVDPASQGYVHYIYDDEGNPTWLTAGGVINGIPAGEDLVLSQWSGYCPVCTKTDWSYEDIGTFTADYQDEDSMTWTQDYVLLPPLSGSINRTDDTSKLTTPVACQ